MKLISSIVTTIVVAVCVCPFADARQAPSATDAPLSAAAINDLFKESAALGKDEALVLEEAKSLASDEKTFIQFEGTALTSEREFAKASNAAVMSACDKKDWSKPGYQQCPGMVEADVALHEKYDKHQIEYKTRLGRFGSDKEKLKKRYEDIQVRLDTIDTILSRQKAFTDAVDKCDQLRTLEAQSQCMQKQIDGAGTPKKNITIEDPENLTVVVPKPSGGRTPSQAIEEYIKSGPPKPVLRPTGDKKEPPPPGQ